MLLAVAAALSIGCSPAAGEAPLPVDLASQSMPLTGSSADYRPLLSAAAEARFILLGESTHGTHEFYLERGRITDQFVRQQGVLALALEADAPEAERVNRYVRGLGSDRTAEEALSSFERFPRWMWRNIEFAQAVDHLRAWNLTRPVEQRVGVYGLDVYNPFQAAAAVVAYARGQDPVRAGRIEAHYRCFAQYRTTEAYGLATRRPNRSCEMPVKAALAEMEAAPQPSGVLGAEAHFAALHQAHAVVGGEAYLRASYAGAYAWNVRDTHMTAAAERVAAHVGRGSPGRVVIWAHNTHVGDARGTDMRQRGELNIGQLLRQRHGRRSFSLGFMTHDGTVLAAPEWDAAGRTYRLRPARKDSFAGLFRSSGLRRALLIIRDRSPEVLRIPRLQRAVGVIYLPNEERTAHYFQATLAEQFDAVVYLDQTKAVSPLG